MKNFLKIFLIINTLIILNINISYSYELNDKEIKIVKKTINGISINVNKNGITYRDKLIKQIKKYINKFDKNSKQYSILDLLIKEIYKINLEKNYQNHYNEYKIDFEKIKNYWIDIHNQARKELNLKNYSYDSRLNSTSYERSTIQKQKGIMEHKRNPNDSYYNYNVIEKWFNNRGVKCRVINGVTSSESIGKFGFDCNDGECSDELKESIKVIFDIYMKEKNLGFSQNAHYRAIVHPNLSKIGLGISIKETIEKNYFEYYITTHYCSEFIN